MLYICMHTQPFSMINDVPVNSQDLHVEKRGEG